MKKNIVVLAALALGAFSVTAQEDAPALSVSTALGYDTLYVFRGAQCAEDILEPSVDVSYGNFYAGLWFAIPFTNVDVYTNEMDIYFGYSTSVTDMLSVDVGVTHYGYNELVDDLFDNPDNSWEGYVGISADLLLSPSLYIYRDFDYSTYTVEAKISHSFSVYDKVSLDLGANLGEVFYDSYSGDEYTYAGATADVTYTINDQSSFSIGARYGVASEAKIYGDYGSEYQNGDVWVGGSFSTSF